MPLRIQVMCLNAGQRDMLVLGGLWRRSESEVSLQVQNESPRMILRKDQRKDLNFRA